jgi:hypothetical protein
MQYGGGPPIPGSMGPRHPLKPRKAEDPQPNLEMRRRDGTFFLAGGALGPRSSIQTKFDFNVDHDGNGLTVFCCGRESPLGNGTCGLLIEIGEEAALDADI